MLASTEAIQKIREYRLNSLFDPGPNWPPDIANQRCWQQVGCDTLLGRIRENPFAEPMSVVEEFIVQMDKYSEINLQYCDMFQAMKEVGEQVVRILS